MVPRRGTFTYDEEEKMGPGRSFGPKQLNNSMHCNSGKADLHGMRSCGLKAVCQLVTTPHHLNIFELLST
ncbi:hypothetical protein Y032_0017g3423 [Ancylostoma ceylanicum]|uniref:Uncharacterized protein n=1 Tax=Ancylostoma ceylanicum TaxID=53326 RepID=A0A016V4J3_9BILA|nr:hypothetical protein Y032_0017g3423 [Ancylostoma ceylanicum]